MTGLGYHTDIKVTELIDRGRFTLSAEVIPPRNGAEQSRILNQIESLTNAGADFLSVTKGAGGSLRGGSLPIAQAIKERFRVPCIAHFTCRDLTSQDVENQLMDHHYFGIRNILALRGDPPSEQPDWKPLEGSHQYAYQLIEQIQKLNSGVFLPRKGGPPPKEQIQTDFCIGAAVYPEHPNEKERIDFFQKKVDRGAQFAITQMLFDADAYGRFLDLCEKSQVKIPVLPGLPLLKSQKQAIAMAERFQVSVPKKVLHMLPESLPKELPPEEKDRRLKMAVKASFQHVQDLKKLGAPGVHLFVLFDTKGITQLLKELRSTEAQG